MKNKIGFLLFILPILLINIEFSQASEICAIFENQHIKKLPNTTTVDTIGFGGSSLICDTTANKSKYKNTQSQWYEKADLSIIRGHILEIDPKKVIHHAHGYSLIKGVIKCANEHCGHISQLSLKQFKGINLIPKSAQKAGVVNPTIQDAVNRVSSSLWLADDVTLSGWSRRSGSTGNNNAADWIEDKMNALDLTVSKQPFTVSGNPTNNIIGIKAGTSRPNDWYIVGAHMDSIPRHNSPAPGAIDNASGCSGVLELARVASQFTFEGTIIFMCYSGEEQGLIGSRLHVRSIVNNNNKDKVKAVLTMDMIGYTRNSNHDLLLETSSTHIDLMNRFVANAATYVPNLNVITSTNPFGSDHVPYLNNGIPSILSIDDDWSVYPGYHRTTDISSNINTTQGEYILKTNMASLAELAGIKP